MARQQTIQPVSRNKLIGIYRKRARHYDSYAGFFPRIGLALWAYREKAVQALNLHEGDRVVEIGCGTGLNFPLLEDAVGSGGAIIGVDLTDAMLEQARKRIDTFGWKNISLIQSDAADFVFPEGVDGVISTYALTLVPEYDDVIQNGSRALKPGRRLVVVDFKMPAQALSQKLASLMALFLIRPFGGSISMANRHPWESMSKYLQNVEMTEFYMGMVYLAVAEKASVFESAGVQSISA